jgi:hypothetical protein
MKNMHSRDRYLDKLVHKVEKKASVASLNKTLQFTKSPNKRVKKTTKKLITNDKPRKTFSAISKHNNSVLRDKLNAPPTNSIVISKSSKITTP